MKNLFPHQLVVHDVAAKNEWCMAWAVIHLHFGLHFLLFERELLVAGSESSLSIHPMFQRKI
jgi:hypothetical protein